MSWDYGGYTRAEMERLLVSDWVYGVTGGRLHHVEQIDGPADGGCVGVMGRTACGRTGAWFIPGVFSRIGLARCSQCCRALRLPQGKGSPKNDKGALRAWMDAELEERGEQA